MLGCQFPAPEIGQFHFRFDTDCQQTYVNAFFVYTAGYMGTTHLPLVCESVTDSWLLIFVRLMLLRTAANFVLSVQLHLPLLLNLVVIWKQCMLVPLTMNCLWH